MIYIKKPFLFIITPQFKYLITKFLQFFFFQSPYSSSILNNIITHMDYCTLDCILINGNLNQADMCTFTQNQCNQDTVQFVQSYYCFFRGSFLILAFLGIPFFMLLFKTLNVIAQEYLSPCVEEFIEQFKISPTLAGVTFLAFANGAPDVMTAIIAGSSDSGTTALIPFGSIFGACLFSTAFILSAVIFMQPNETVELKVRQFVLPLSFYVVSILFIIGVTTIYGKMNIYLATVLLIFYIIYIIFVLKGERDQKKKERLLTMGQNPEDNNVVSSTDKGTLITVKNEEKQANQVQVKPKQQNFMDVINNKVEAIENLVLSYLIPFYKIDQWDPKKAIISLIISPFLIALTQSVPGIFKDFIGPIPVFLIICLPAICLLPYTIFCIVREQEPQYMKVYTVYSFIVSVCALTVVCSILINFVELVQILTEINSVFLGLTVFAWANSIGDYLTITHFAKNGNPKTAIAGIFSGQLFNFLLGFGVSLMIQSITNGEYEYKIFDFQGTTYDKISDTIVMSVIFGGLLYLIFVLVIAIKNKGIFMRKEAAFAKWYYVGFLILSVVLALMTDFFREIQCPL